MSNGPKQTEWEKIYDERFPISIDYPPMEEMEVFTQMEIDARHKRALAKHEEIRLFITSLLLSQRQEIVKSLEGMKIDDKEHTIACRYKRQGCNCGKLERMIYNKALSDAISIISKGEQK